MVLFSKRIIKLLCVSIVLSAVLFIISFILIDYRYGQAVNYFENGEYESSLECFSVLGYYKQSGWYRDRIEFELSEKNVIIQNDLNDDKNDKTEEDVIYLVSTQESAKIFRRILNNRNLDDDDAPVFDSQETIAVDAVGNEYSVQNIADQKVVICFGDSDFDVMFLGQINEKGQWDGDCLFNVYKGNYLQNATLAKYSDGKRKEYEQVFWDENDCVFSMRTCKDDYNIGDTWKYKNDGYLEKSFSLDDLEVSDFILPQSIKNNISSSMIGRYHGITQNGYYEDATGNAYLISYYDDGKIKTLYNGQFAKGRYNDKSGNAWYITCNREENVNYMYYKGKFENGVPLHSDNNSDVFNNAIDYSEVSALVDTISYDGILNWDMDYMTK